MKEEDKENLKVIRLDNGEILFSKITVPENKKDGYLELQWPMRVYMKFNQAQKSLDFSNLSFSFCRFVPEVSARHRRPWTNFRPRELDWNLK